MSDPRGIFISYAREDLEAASKIADALRAAGLEVWLDLSELRGGDAWDGQIRRQIRDCALFLAVISQRTQVRREGYFRLEWHLAEERSRLIARGTPFLVPVVIDDTTEREALVPDSFLAVQWTRLAGGAVPPAFPERVRRLVAGGAEMNPRPHPPARPPSPRPATVVPPRRPNFALLGGLGAAAVAVALLIYLRPWSHPAPAAAAESAPTGSDSLAPDFPHDLALRRAMYLVNSVEAVPEDYALAEDFAQGVLSQKPMDPEAATVMAWVQNAFIYRGFDQSQARAASAKRYAERAVQLAPDNAYAQGAFGICVYDQGRRNSTDLALAEEALDRAIALAPTLPILYRFRDDALFLDDRVSTTDALAAAERDAARFPRDALTHYELSRHYRDVGRLQDMERELDRTLAIQPIVNALVWKSRVALWVRGDPEEMKAILDRVPGRGRNLERVVLTRWVYAMATGKTQEALDNLDSMPESWVDDYDYIGPKLLLVAALQERAGQRELAAINYAAALTQARQQEAQAPGDLNLMAVEAWCLHGLGRDEETRKIIRALNEDTRRPYRVGFGNSWWFEPIAANLLFGDRATGLQFLREAVSPGAVGAGKVIASRGTEVTRDGYASSARDMLRAEFNVDPRMAPLRNDQEIRALLDPPGGAPAHP